MSFYYRHFDNIYKQFKQDLPAKVVPVDKQTLANYVTEYMWNHLNDKWTCMRLLKNTCNIDR